MVEYESFTDRHLAAATLKRMTISLYAFQFDFPQGSRFGTSLQTGAAFFHAAKTEASVLVSFLPLEISGNTYCNSEEVINEVRWMFLQTSSNPQDQSKFL